MNRGHSTCPLQYGVYKLRSFGGKSPLARHVCDTYLCIEPIHMSPLAIYVCVHWPTCICPLVLHVCIHWPYTHVFISGVRIGGGTRGGGGGIWGRCPPPPRYMAPPPRFMVPPPPHTYTHTLTNTRTGTILVD